MKNFNLVFAGLLVWPAIFLANAQQKTDREAVFFEQIVFPFAHKISLLSQLPFERAIQTNDVLKWRCEYVLNTSEMTGVFLSLTNRKFLDLRVKGTNCVIWHFADGQINPLGIAGREDSAKAKFYAAMPNQFTRASALAFAEEFVKVVGDDLASFRLDKSWQIAWGNPEITTNYFLLPFYEFQWLAKNVTEPEAGALYPSIKIIVSGITKKVVSYDRLQLPVVTDAEFRRRYSTNSNEIYQPRP